MAGNQYDFADKHAVVTGGASGIGLAIAHLLSAGGAVVSLWDHNAEVLKKAQAGFAGREVHGVTVDVSDEASVAAAVAQSETHGGTVQILVNSAGITGPNKTVCDYSVEDWDKVMAVNLRGTFLCCRALAPGMTTSGYGRIINIASIAGKEGNPNASAYSASKAAVIGLTKSLGKELAKTGVTVNCVTPAAVHTAIFDQMTQQHIDYMLSKIPMGRFGQTEEVAALVGWLASPDCSFTTGGTFDISGGRATY
ncbi:MAG TPA: SDR family NAD(P)-dependent oxidoreductase [Castellaniella sp.]|uniref:SDR family NAD(P)-dependent oxidoreductase n=1 Tax=Castellaniella sp. TaxID=1955812 RepID=UPI002F013215